MASTGQVLSGDSTFPVITTLQELVRIVLKWLGVS